MKCALILLVALAVGSNAMFLSDFSDQIDSLKVAGSTLVNGIVAKGKEVLSALLQTSADALKNVQIGRRHDVDWDSFKAKWQDKADGVKNHMKDRFSAGLQKLKELMSKFKAMKDSSKTVDEAHKAVDVVVDETTDALDKSKRLWIETFETLANQALGVATDVLTSDAAQKLALAAAEKAVTAAIGKRNWLDSLKDAAATALEAAKNVASNEAVQALALKAAEAAAIAAIGKRNVMSNIADFFGPHIETLKNTVAGLGDTLKGHATNLWNGVKDQVTSLGSKLTGHVDKLKGHGQTLLDHGKNALDALKGAIGDVLSQTLKNAGPSVSGLITTGTDAIGVVASHVADAVSGN